MPLYAVMAARNRRKYNRRFFLIVRFSSSGNTSIASHQTFYSLDFVHSLSQGPQVHDPIRHVQCNSQKHDPEANFGCNQKQEERQSEKLKKVKRLRFRIVIDLDVALIHFFYTYFPLYLGISLHDTLCN